MLACVEGDSLFALLPAAFETLGAMAKGCLLSLIAAAISFLLLIPLEALYNHMGWSGFNGESMHAGTWVFAWWVLFGVSYCVLLALDHWWRTRSKHYN